MFSSSSTATNFSISVLISFLLLSLEFCQFTFYLFYCLIITFLYIYLKFPFHRLIFHICNFLILKKCMTTVFICLMGTFFCGLVFTFHLSNVTVSSFLICPCIFEYILCQFIFHFPNILGGKFFLSSYLYLIHDGEKMPLSFWLEFPL